MNSLKGKIALVAGATRGAGRGIACMLGAAGATVYCTGRSTRSQLASGKNRPETIEETAEKVTEMGGKGIWVQVDHTVEAQVKTLFEKIKKEQGQLDILVNDVWGGDALTEWGKPFWELEMSKGWLMQERAIQAHVMTSRYGVPLMLDTPDGLVVEITDGDAYQNAQYRGNLFYDLVKVSGIRLAKAMAQELRETTLTAVAITPGFLRSEAVLEHFGVTEETWKEAIEKDAHFAQSETPFYLGKAIAALAADPLKRTKNGQSLSSWALAEEYGFTDVDGRQPHWGNHTKVHLTPFWEKLNKAVTQQSHDLGIDQDHIAMNQEGLTIEGKITHQKKYTYQLTFIDVFFSEPQTIAKNFFAQYQELLAK